MATDVHEVKIVGVTKRLRNCKANLTKQIITLLDTGTVWGKKYNLRKVDEKL